MKLCLLCSSKFDDQAEKCSRDGSRLVPAGQDNLLGTVLGERYLLEELIAKGSVGRVYKAKQLSNNKLVAIKVLRENLYNDAEALTRFRREAQMLSILEHPNILTLFDFGQTASGEPYFAAEFLDGKTLTQLINERRALSVSEALPIFYSVCLGLGEAHSHGFIHRDIKPSNIMISEGAHPSVKLLDFSLAKLPPLAVDDRVTTEGMLRGTPAYMSPEQCQSMEVDERSDIYSLGVVIFETLTGSRPFASKNSVITMHQQINDVPPRMVSLRPDLHFCQELETLVQSCLNKKPSGRPATVEQFWHEFQEACAAQAEIMSLPGKQVDSMLPEPPPVIEPTPLAAFQEAEQHRIRTDAILAKQAAEKEPTERRVADGYKDAIETQSTTLSLKKLEKKHEGFLSKLLADELGRKVVLGLLCLILLVILVMCFLFMPIGSLTP